MKTYLLLSSLLLISFASHSMEQIKQIVPIKGLSTMVEFNGQKQPIISLINTVIMSGEGEKQPFSATLIVKEVEVDNNAFALKGDILDLDNKDSKNISAGKAFYCQNFASIKTRLSPKRPQAVAAIIYAQNIQKCHELCSHVATLPEGSLELLLQNRPQLLLLKK